MDFDEIMNADRHRKQEAIRLAELAAQAEHEAKKGRRQRERAKNFLATVSPVLKTMRERWEKRFKKFPEYRCVGLTSPAAGPPKGIRWVRLSISPAQGGSASKNFDLHASADPESGTIQVLGYSERYPTIVIESGLEPSEVTEQKIDDILAQFAEWFTNLGRRASLPGAADQLAYFSLMIMMSVFSSSMV